MRNPAFPALFLFLLATLAPALTLNAPGEVRTCACEPFSYQAWLEQGRAPAETFDLELLATSPRFSAHVTPRLTLQPKERAAVSVYANPACTLPPGDYAFQLRATSRSGAEATAQTNVRVEECSLVQARLDLATPACACGSARYEVILTNQGSAASDVSLATNLPGAELAKDRLLLAAGQEARVSLYVVIPCGATQPQPFEVSVQSRRGPQVLSAVLEPNICAVPGLAVTPTPSPAPVEAEGAAVVARVEVTQQPSAFSGLFAGALSTWPWFILVLAALAVLYYVLKDREFHNPFAKPKAEVPPAEVPHAEEEEQAKRAALYDIPPVDFEPEQEAGPGIDELNELVGSVEKERAKPARKPRAKRGTKR